LNAEGDALRNAIPGSVEVRGSDTVEHKERTLIDFSHGKIRVLVSKPSICGFGLNFQVCHNMAFVGVTDSWESYYQAVRRCWRFGQNNPVNVHIFASESEGAVVANLARKEKDAEIMQDNLSRETLESIRQSVKGQLRIRNEYSAVSRIEIPRWIHTGV
jgi:SNF2 family DNA or RNA helicase